MMMRAPVMAVLLLSQQAGTLLNEAKGLHILWVPSAMAGLSNEAPGFKVQDPLTQNDRTFTQADDLKPILDTLPTQMKENGIWISTGNSFLYVADEKLQLKALVDLATTRGISVFMCELGEQPKGWKKVEFP
jgi:hypothetical protein